MSQKEKQGKTPQSVADLDLGAATAGGALSSPLEAKAPKGTEYPDDYPEDQMMDESKTKSSGVTIDEAPLIHPGAFVKLGKHKLVPKQHEGVIAMVMEAPRYQCTGCDLSPRLHEHQPEDTVFTVRTRDATDTILVVPRKAFADIGYDGRKDLLPHG